MKKFYNQAQTSVVYNGYPLQGLGEGASNSIELLVERLTLQKAQTVVP